MKLFLDETALDETVLDEFVADDKLDETVVVHLNLDETELHRSRGSVRFSSREHWCSGFRGGEGVGRLDVCTQEAAPCKEGCEL